MMFPRTLPESVKAKAFRAANGELGVLPTDALAFLDACRSDRVEVLGWELWLIDHAWDGAPNGPVSAPGSWCGFTPMRGRALPAVVGGAGDLEKTATEIAALQLDADVEPFWRPHIRINFTLGD